MNNYNNYDNNKKTKTTPKQKKPVSNKTRQKINIIKILAITATILIFSFISILIPFRPTTSDIEKRELAKFPTFSFESLANGDFFDGINDWFSDTFTFKDFFMGIGSNYEKWYGIKNTQTLGEVVTGDDIPDVVSKPNTTSSNAPTSSKEETSSNQTSSTTVSSQGASSNQNSTSSGGTSVSSKEPDNQPEPPVQALASLCIVGDSAYEYYNFVLATADNYTNIINRAEQNLNGISNVYDMVVPNSMGIMLSDEMRNNLNTSDQKKAIDYMYSTLNPNVKTVNVFDTLKAHNNEYIYFRTDHHWTALGAYYSYCELMKTKGVTPVSLNSFTTESYGDYLGSFYSGSNKNPALSKPDELIAYNPNYDTDMFLIDNKGKRLDWQVVMDVSGWAKSSKYNAFSGGDNPYTEITNNTISDGSSCIVVKESYGNAMIPFLTAHYQKVYVIDYRYYKDSLTGLAKKVSADDVFFINTISTTRASTLVNKIGELVDR